MTLNAIKPALAASAAALAFALPALAASPAAAPPQYETLCLAGFLAMAGNGDETTRNAGLMGSLYYAGRVEGKNPGKDPLDLVVAVFGRPTSTADIQAAMPQCGQDMQAMGKRWTERGEELQRAASSAGK
ncbi:MAG: hypothetical protein K9G59_01145 [Caulobacter sp.]|nr:hypothetical protein [Caulobacter sp.]